MKHNLKYVISLVFMLLLTQSTWADPTVTIIKKLNGTTNTSAGTVADPVIANGKCTLTVTPAQGNYVTKDFITVHSVVDGSLAQAPRRSPNLDNTTIEVRNVGANTDPSGETQYEFTYPTDGSDAEVTIDFQSRTALTADMVTLSASSFVYNADTQKPTVTVKNGESTLTENTDYTLTNEGGTDVNSYDVKVTGKGIYSGEVTKTFAITPATITEVTLENASLTYTGAEQTAVVASVKAGELTLTTDDYEVSNNKATAKGTYELTVTAKETSNFTGSKKAGFSIGAADIAELYDISLSSTSLVYNGSEQQPAVVFKKGEEVVTPSTDDYEVTYANNINVASADAETGAPTVTITGKNNLTGSIEKKFTITALSLATGFTVNVDATKTYTYTGEDIEPAVTVTPTGGGNALVVNTDYTVSYSNNKNAATATSATPPTVTITGTGNYTGSTFGTFTIEKATPTISFAQESYSATLGESFTSPATVDNWTVSPTASSNTSVANISEGQIVLVGVGTTTITVTYAGNDNYNSTTASYQLVVSRALDIEFAGTNSWASYYATENLTVPTGLTAYVVSDVDEQSGAVTVTSIGYIPKNNAVLLEREQNGAASGYTAGAYTGTTTTVNNLLGGSPNTTDISSLGSGPVYVLFNDKFKRAISGTIPARRAYLVPGTIATAGAPQYLTISITDGNTTAIDTLTVDDDSNASWYTIDGLKLNGKPQHKGLYINNGKKVYINNNK